MKSFLWVTVETNNQERFFLKCQEKSIFLYECISFNQEIKIKILASDYPKIKSIWFIKVKESQETGLNLIKKKIKKYHIFLLSLLVGLVVLFCFSNLILSVEVIHSSEDIRFLVKTALEEKGIKKNIWKKSYQEITQIKEEILDEFQDKLEWLEIENSGMKYIVRVEERKMKEEPTTPRACNVVATKDGIIKEMIYSKGSSLVKQNDVVKKGDILLSGTIMKDEEIKNVVCATGKVYAEVWYTVKISVPMTYDVEEKTGKVRYNIRLKNKGYNDFLFKSRVEEYTEEAKFLFSLFQTEVSFVKQHETIKNTKTYTEEEALNKATTEALAKIESTLEEKEEILTKKVLKKEVNNSTMNIEVFVSVLEQIGTRQEFQIEE